VSGKRQWIVEPMVADRSHGELLPVIRATRVEWTGAAVAVPAARRSDGSVPGGDPYGTKSWFGFTDLQGFFADKNVNVVSPLGGQFSWYTDWVNDRSKQYQTYMTQELPPLINAQYKTNGRNAVGGLSSTGGTAADYAIQAPGLYKAVGSYSGFLTPSSGAQKRRTDTHWWRRKRRRHVGSAGRPAVGGARPDGERREAQGCRGLRCRVGRRAWRRRQAAPRRQ
jgi:S-formylglutathione hydrolase FrmB